MPARLALVTSSPFSCGTGQPLETRAPRETHLAARLGDPAPALELRQRARDHLTRGAELVGEHLVGGVHGVTLPGQLEKLERSDLLRISLLGQEYQLRHRGLFRPVDTEQQEPVGGQQVEIATFRRPKRGKRFRSSADCCPL